MDIEIRGQEGQDTERIIMNGYIQPYMGGLLKTTGGRIREEEEDMKIQVREGWTVEQIMPKIKTQPGQDEDGDNTAPNPRPFFRKTYSWDGDENENIGTTSTYERIHGSWYVSEGTPVNTSQRKEKKKDKQTMRNIILQYTKLDNRPRA